MKNKTFIKMLIQQSGEDTGCTIQYKGSPCNTCFHNWAKKDLGLHPRLAHALWLVCLSLRGDNKPEEMTDAIAEL